MSVTEVVTLVVVDKRDNSARILRNFIRMVVAIMDDSDVQEGLTNNSKDIDHVIIVA